MILDDLIRCFTPGPARVDDTALTQTFKGFCPGWMLLRKSLPLTFEANESMDDPPYRFVWTSELERAIVTWVEGDVVIEVAFTIDGYEEAVERAEAFYANLRNPDPAAAAGA